MKKSLWIGGAVIAAVTFATLTALAMVIVEVRFGDSSKFESWYGNSVYSMANSGVLTGYPDGSFKPENNVNRAELAVILDRFNQNIVSKMGENGGGNSGVSKSDVEYMIQRSLASYDKFSSLNLDRFYKMMIVMADAGLKRLPAKPDLTDFTQDNNVQLPQGYTLYTRSQIIVNAYLNYVGPRVVGDVGMQVDEWYGPF